MAEKGLVVRLKDRDGGIWVVDMQTGLAKRSPPRQSRVAVETCARCHSRRSVVHEDYVYGRPLMDTHRPALLDEALYHAGGQILEEVYVYGSFLQSKMFREGVTCQDCHDPHRLTVRGSGNSMCAACHLTEKFDTKTHHFHPPGSRGASCVECHMPATSYMVVDPRRDHSLRVPRPDLTVKIGTPNACNRCHTDRPAEWAAETVANWYGPQRAAESHFGEALYAGRNGVPGAEAALVGLAGDPAMPSIARATALSLLGRYAGSQSLAVLPQSLDNGDPLIRAAALGTLEAVEPRSRLVMGYPLLSDPIRFVRLEAARVLASVPSDQMTPVQRASLDHGLEEFRNAQLVNADRAGYHLNLGVLHQQLGELEKAEGELRTALRLDPSYTPAYVNLADVFRLRNQDGEGERTLREGLAIAPDDGALHHSLGLLLARQKRHSEAVEALRRAAEFRPEEPRYSYVYGAALHSVGETDRALAVLGRAHERHPGNRELLIALATMSRDNGSLSAAVEYARKLLELSPQDPAARQFLTQLEAARE
jgi:Flp pilus assembly protein TadD